MSTAQTRVLVILLGALGLEALFSPAFQAAIKQLRAGNFGASVASVETGGTVAAAGAYALAMLALIAFAAAAPRAATWLALLILVYVLLAHGAQIVPWVTQVRGSLSQLKGSPAPGGPTATPPSAATTRPAA